MAEYCIDNGERAVREFVADLLEKFSSQIENGEAPKISINYFGATLEVKLLAFEGITNLEKEPH